MSESKNQEQTVWTKDSAHARLGFSVKHMTISNIEGHFREFSAQIVSALPDFSDAQIEMEAKVESIDTSAEARNDHLVSEDFFDAKNYPLLTFTSTSVRPVGDSFAKIFGYLTCHGVKKLIELDAVLYGTITNEDKTRSTGMQIIGTIKRSDFNLGKKFPEAVIGDLVKLNVNAEFISGK